MSGPEPLTPREIELTAELLSALDSELRLKLLLLLDGGDKVVHEMVASIGKSQPLISQHLRVLKSAGLVSSRRSGREVIYSLAQPAVIEAITHLASVAAPDELASKRRAPHMAADVAIIEPPHPLRPGTDPGLSPHTPKPQRD